MNNESGGSKLREKIKETLGNFSNLPDEQKNFLHVYFGYGKGKTTSSIGLAIRALGAGRKVAMVQFDKGFDGTNEHYSERHILRKLKEAGYDIEIYPTGCERMNEDGTFRFKNEESDFAEAKRGLQIARELITNGRQSLLILDEIIATVIYHLLEEK
ncbi:MAG: cob(I)yrinic acid a,c-diamide adenosyltransferase, partial [Ignavibacteria bacterium]|nr:cob(I)yrinic acid a,c-diamide adenosyltransferase [Ignavibacteria bacterium]